MEECYYNILGVGKLASEREIRKAYKRLALKFHPDKQTNEEARKDATEVFVKINNAHEVLTDPVQRKHYDEKLEASRAKRSTKNSSKNQRQGANSSSSRQQPRSSSSHHYTYARSSRWKDHQGRQGHGDSQQRAWSSNPKQQSSTDGGTSWSSARSHKHGSSNYSSKPKAHRSSRNTTGGFPKPSPESHSSANAHRAWKQPHVFGRSKTTDEPCRRCMHQGRYCFQHKDQDPSSTQYHRQKPHSQPKPDFDGQTVFGKNLNGQPCRRCMKQGGFCYQHKDQQFESKKRSHPGSRRRPMYGVRTDGEPCQRCMKQGRFCFQHAYQQK